jgi:hypothetical protein
MTGRSLLVSRVPAALDLRYCFDATITEKACYADLCRHRNSALS